MTSTVSLIREKAALARAAGRKVAILPTPVKDAALLRIAELLEAEADALRAVNERDLAEGRDAGLDPYFIDRLKLDPAKTAADTRGVAALPDPIGQTIEGRTLDNGIRLSKRRVPIGVIGAIYEARPNVTVDIAALALKSGNAAVLRGGKEAKHTNRALGELIQRALAETGVPGDAVQVISDPDRAHVDELLKANDLVDLVVPRGSESLISYVRANATMPVVAHGEAVVNIYVDAGADLEMALDIVDNAKQRRYSICNAVDTVLVHVAIAPRFLAALANRWAGRVTMIAGDRALALLPSGNGSALQVVRATEETWRTEHLALRAGIKLVDSVEEAIEHIETYGSHHSDAIVTNDYAAATKFVDEVDSSAVYVNASTQFTDGGEFGLGAEVGISTQKMHARGPMGLVELTSYKWIAMGTGQVRPA
jgi:glutamate-5-semialdehyde dehydrogenase